MNTIEGTRLWTLLEGGHYRRVDNIEGTRRWATIGSGRLLSPLRGTIGLWSLSATFTRWALSNKLAHWRETGGGDRSCREIGGGDRRNAIMGTVARLAAVIDWAWKAEIGLGKLESCLESWNLILQVHSSFCRTSQLELQFSIGIVYTIGLRALSREPS